MFLGRQELSLIGGWRRARCAKYLVGVHESGSVFGFREECYGNPPNTKKPKQPKLADAHYYCSQNKTMPPKKPRKKTRAKFGKPLRSDESSFSDSDDTNFSRGDGSESDENLSGVEEEEEEDDITAYNNDYLLDDDDSSIMTETANATAPTKKRPKIAKVSFSPEKLPPSTPKKGSHHTVEEKCLSNQLSTGLKLGDDTDLGEGMGVHVKSTGMGNFEYDGDDDSGGGYDSDDNGGGKPRALEGGREKGASVGLDNSDSMDDDAKDDEAADNDGSKKPKIKYYKAGGTCVLFVSS